MDKGEVIELVDEYVKNNKYDRRFVPFLQSYILKCVQVYNWDSNTVKEKLDEYCNKIKNIEFLNIGRQRILVDIDNKTILVDERIKYNTEDYTLDEYINASYKEQDKILQTNTFLSLVLYDTSNLKEEIKHAYKTYNKDLLEEKVVFEIIALIQQKNYDRRFIPFIKEYFLRSAQIFNWNRDELEKKVANFKSNVDAIEVKKLKKKCVEYSPIDKKIYLNKSLHTYSNDVIIKNLFREQGYATNYTRIDNKVYENGLYTNSETNDNEKSLNAYVEEVSANYLTGRVPYSNEFYTTCRVSENDRRDYNNKTSYAASMFASAFGISEFEFAVLKDKGRARFNEYFRARFEYMDTVKYVNEFFDIVLNLEKAPDTMFTTKGVTEQYSKMYNLSMNILNERVQHELANAKPEEEKTIKLEESYFKYKIVNTLKQAKRNQCLEIKVINSIVEDTKSLNKYSKISKVTKHKFKKVAKSIYSDTDTLFDNSLLISTIVNEFKYPWWGRLMKMFGGKKENLLLAEGNDSKNWMDYLSKTVEERKKELAKSEIIVPQKDIFNFNENTKNDDKE